MNVVLNELSNEMVPTQNLNDVGVIRGLHPFSLEQNKATAFERGRFVFWS